MSGDDPTDEIEAKAPYTKLVTKVKRGTGTRDQDTTKVVTRHRTPEAAAADHERALSALRHQAETARDIQPEVDDET